MILIFEIWWSRTIKAVITWFWSRIFDDLVVWSGKNCDLKFLDHQISWSHDFDPANSMIFRIFNFWLWALNFENIYFLQFQIFWWYFWFFSNKDFFGVIFRFLKRWFSNYQSKYNGKKIRLILEQFKWKSSGSRKWDFDPIIDQNYNIKD